MKENIGTSLITSTFSKPNGLRAGHVCKRSYFHVSRVNLYQENASKSHIKEQDMMELLVYHEPCLCPVLEQTLMVNGLDFREIKDHCLCFILVLKSYIH